MTPFFRFPHTPHLTWLGKGAPRDDKVLSPTEMAELLAGDIVAEEKLDGANLGLSLAPDGSWRVQNRGEYLQTPYSGQFSRLSAWLAQHEAQLLPLMTPHLVLFGEWCAARHSLGYTTLPDWMLLFDVYDRDAGKFWSTARRDTLARTAGVCTVPRVMAGQVTLEELLRYVTTAHSRYRNGPLEGIVVRRQSPEWSDARAKLVRPDFTQAITTHWRSRAIEWNRVRPAPLGDAGCP